jgi:4-aminobutyrate aminotransferase-like enzyme
MIIEPIQAEGGDRHASPEFFRIAADCFGQGSHLHC